MLVKDYMTRHPLMADPTMSIMDAQRYMGENRIRHLPIVGDGKRLLGLVTPHSLLADPSRIGSLDVWEIARYLSRLTVEQAMIKPKDIITIGPNTTIEEAARVMVEGKIGCLPVLEEGILVGIITETDMMAHLMKLLGAPSAWYSRHGPLAQCQRRAGQTRRCDCGARLGDYVIGWNFCPETSRQVGCCC